MTIRMPDPSYVDVNGDAVAWYSIGNGPETLVGSPGMFTAVESMVESPGALRLISRLADIRRVVLFDHRTTGLSDTFSDHRDPTVDDWVDDITAVIDATGRRSVDLFGIGTSVPSVIAAAAAMPDRIRSLMLTSGCPKLIRDENYPEGMAPEVYKSWRDAIWGSFGAVDVERELIGPISESDRTFLRRSGQGGSAPSRSATARSTGRHRRAQFARPGQLPDAHHPRRERPVHALGWRPADGRCHPLEPTGAAGK